MFAQIMKKRITTKRIVIWLLIAIFNPLSLGVMFFGSVFWSNSHPATGENEARVDWLPPEASHVSFYKSYSWTAYEFDIPEAGFRTWASRWQIQDIETPFTITRYKYFTTDHPAYDPNPEGPFYRFEAEAKATITNGYFYRTPPRGNGGGTYVAYDRDGGRAYFQTNPR